MYIHAERLLAKAGGSKRKGRGISHPWKLSEVGVERAARSEGLHKRSAEAWGNPLRARGAELADQGVIPIEVVTDTGSKAPSEGRKTRGRVNRHRDCRTEAGVDLFAILSTKGLLAILSTYGLHPNQR